MGIDKDVNNKNMRIEVLEGHISQSLEQYMSSMMDMMKALATRIDTMEASGQGSGPSGSGGGSINRGYLPEKSLIPKTYDGKLDDWRSWREDFSEFLDNKNTGMQKFLEEIARRRDAPVDDAMVRKWASLGGKVTGDRVQVWRALKALTAGVARTVVMSVTAENGFETWRKFHLQFEPKMVIRQGQVLV